MFGRDLKTEEEKAFWKQAYRIGMKNQWCSGQAAIQDGDFIVEEDRLNQNSCCVIDTVGTLKKFFKCGNWCLGQAVIYKNLCFIQQVNGGDEWLTMKMFKDGIVRDFESITWGPSVRNYGGCYDYSYLSDERERKKAEQGDTVYFKDVFKNEIKELMGAKAIKTANSEGWKIEYGESALINPDDEIISE